MSSLIPSPTKCLVRDSKFHSMLCWMDFTASVQRASMCSLSIALFFRNEASLNLVYIIASLIEVHHSYFTVDLYLCRHLYHLLPNVLNKTLSFILFYVGWTLQLVFRGLLCVPCLLLCFLGMRLH